MDWYPTPNSSNLAGFGYISDSQVLVVEFKNGSRYNYYDVPSQVFEEMKSAESFGKFHAYNIKGVYRYARV